MPIPLRLLLVEDSEDDAMLVLRHLRQSGYELLFVQVASYQGMHNALIEGIWDVVVADYAMPQFSAPAALALMQEHHIDLPFIIISSAIDDEMAVTVLKAGAHDFILKHNLARLAPAISRELREAGVRGARVYAEAEAQRQSARAQVLLRVAARLIGRLDIEGVLDVACGEAAGALDVPIASVRLYDRQRDAFDLAHAVGLPATYTDYASPIIRSALNKHKWRTDGIAIVEDVQTLLDVPQASLSMPDTPFYVALQLGTVAIAQMLHEGELIGWLCVATQGAMRVFTPDELSLLQGVADQVALAIASARLFDAASRRLDRLQALRTIDTVLTSSHDLHTTLDVVLDQVLTQLHVAAAAVLLLDPTTQMLEYAAGHGFRSEAITHTRVPLSEAYVGVVARDRCIYRSIALPNEVAFSRSQLLGDQGFVVYYGVPLIANGRPCGVLELFHHAPLVPGGEWLDFLQSLAEQAAIAIDNATLFASLQRSNAELASAYDATLAGWVSALDLRAQETPGHVQRVTEATMTLAAAMGVPEAKLIHIQRGALLHDIGKLGLPDHILRKPDSLTQEEWALMRKHPLYAYEWLAPIAFLAEALDIPRYHHEHWDGTGYPYGLVGEAIPLAARLFAVIDVWDALRSPRSYRAAWSDKQVKGYLWDLAGIHLDPQVVAVFLTLEPQLIERSARR